MRSWAIIVAIILAFIIGLILFPHLFYDQFIWKYFWGPVVADATGHPVSYHGIQAAEGYTFISELIYGLLLIAAIYALYRIFIILGIVVDARFVLLSLPFILLGPVTRVLEDSGLFNKPLSYFFISPLIYIQIGILFFLSLLFGKYLEKKKDEIKIFTISLFIITLFFILCNFLLSARIGYSLHPFFFIIFSIISLLIFFLSKKDYLSAFFSLGILFLLPWISYIAIWMYGERWASYSETHSIIIPLVITIASSITILTYIFARFFKIKAYASILNLSLIFAHMIDGWTSYFAVVDPFHMGLSYGEKHPLPLLLMQKFGLSYPIIKFVVIIAIIYAMDIYLKEELKEKLTLANLIKFFILILGLAPGLRDMLRIAMGI